MKQRTQQPYLWWSVSGAALLGLVASFIQTVERIQFAAHPTVPLTCNINAVFSCSNVFNAWQSSVFGFSNSIMCLTFFSIMLGVGLAGLSGAAIAAWLRRLMHFFSVFFLGFGAWYLWQSTFRIGALCIFCLFCYGAVIILNWAWLRINIDDLGFRPKTAQAIKRQMRVGADVFGWTIYALAIGATMLFHFYG